VGVRGPEAFLADILAEPEVLAGCLDAYGRPGGPLEGVHEIGGRSALFIGMGSSRFAALAAAALLRARGWAAVVERASTGAPSPPSPDTVVIAISASGETEETVEAVRRHRGSGRVVAVTNRPESGLALQGDVVLPLLAGDERGGIACRTYQCTVAVLLALCGRLLGDESLSPGRLLSAVDALRELHEARERWVGSALEILGGGPLYVVAPEERLASAEQSALMLREAPRVPAGACETGDWLHVDVYLTRRPGYRAILFPGSRFDGRLMEWIERRGSAVVSVGAPVPGAAYTVGYRLAAEPLIALLVETSAVELLAAELWARSST
jgi:fructoselysine-6-P-deglycase FrlB-like protein